MSNSIFASHGNSNIAWLSAAFFRVQTSVVLQQHWPELRSAGQRMSALLWISSHLWMSGSPVPFLLRRCPAVRDWRILLVLKRSNAFHPSVNNSSYFPGPQPRSPQAAGPFDTAGPLPDQRPLFILHVTGVFLAGAGYCDNLLFVSVRSAGAVRPLRLCPGQTAVGRPTGTATCLRNTQETAAK